METFVNGIGWGFLSEWMSVLNNNLCVKDSRISVKILYRNWLLNFVWRNLKVSLENVMIEFDLIIVPYIPGVLVEICRFYS